MDAKIDHTLNTAIKRIMRMRKLLPYLKNTQCSIADLNFVTFEVFKRYKMDFNSRHIIKDET